MIQDPALLSEMSYEPYRKLTEVKGSVMWRDGPPGEGQYKDTTGALLGYVSLNLSSSLAKRFIHSPTSEKIRAEWIVLACKDVSIFILKPPNVIRMFFNIIPVIKDDCIIKPY